MRAMTAQLVEQCAGMGVCPSQHEQDRVRREHGDERYATLVLQNGHGQRARTILRAEVVGSGDDGGDERRSALAIDSCCTIAVNEQTVAPKQYGGLDSIPPAQGANEVANCGHVGSSFRWCEARPCPG